MAKGVAKKFKAMGNELKLKEQKKQRAFQNRQGDQRDYVTNRSTPSYRKPATEKKEGAAVVRGDQKTTPKPAPFNFKGKGQKPTPVHQKKPGNGPKGNADKKPLKHSPSKKELTVINIAGETSLDKKYFKPTSNGTHAYCIVCKRYEPEQFSIAALKEDFKEVSPVISTILSVDDESTSTQEKFIKLAGAFFRYMESVSSDLYKTKGIGSHVRQDAAFIQVLAPDGHGIYCHSNYTIDKATRTINLTGPIEVGFIHKWPSKFVGQIKDNLEAKGFIPWGDMEEIKVAEKAKLRKEKQEKEKNEKN